VPRLPSGVGSTSAKPGSQPLCNTCNHSPSPACGHYRRPSGLQTARTGPKPGSLCRTALSRPTSSRRPPRGLPLPSRPPTSPPPPRMRLPAVPPPCPTSTAVRFVLRSTLPCKTKSIRHGRAKDSVLANIAASVAPRRTSLSQNPPRGRLHHDGTSLYHLANTTSQCSYTPRTWVESTAIEKNIIEH
jgi:hypothetical protein